MRQIKFRAWDKENKEMLFFTYSGVSRPTRGGYEDIPKSDFWDRKEGKRNARLEFDNAEEDVTGYNHDDFNETVESELMQFTGLLDKNGKEIYEGDVIEIRTPEDYGGENEPDGKLQYLCTQEVKRSKESSGFFSEEDNGDYCPALGSDEIEVEIIGNIYENSELLK